MEKSSFFNSINKDRLYKAEDYAQYFSSFIGNGIFPNPSTNLQAIANNNMTVTLKLGKAWINGYFYFNNDDLILSIDAADGVLNRIDRLVIRFDTVNRNITAKIKKGTFASTPVAPTLQRDADGYELAIADIYVVKGAVSITQANITDIRLDANLCGLVSGTVEQVDVTTLFNQYQESFQLKENEFEQEFENWFNNVKGQLSGDVAGNLQNQIDNINSELDSMELVDTSVQITDANNHFTATTLDGALEELFTSANNGKTSVANAIGSPSTATETFIQLANDISTHKNTMATNLTNKGQSSTGTESLSSLASKIANIALGKKWASGTLAGGGSTLTISNLNFRPSFIIARVRCVYSNSDFQAVYVSPNMAYKNHDFNITTVNVNSSGSAGTVEVNPWTINSNGFVWSYMYTTGASDIVSWVAFE